MNYIYDITLNLSKNNLYEFYEWREVDEPEFILKIPVYKIDKEAFIDFKKNDIIINKKFLESIEDKTESYSPNSIGIIRYASVFINEESAIAIEFDSDGNSYMKSNLSIDEEVEIIEATKQIKYTLIDYKIKQKNKVNNKYLTRYEQELSNSMLKKIEMIKKNNQISKLKYIFYELYNEKIDDTEKIYSKLVNVIKNDTEKVSKLNEILMLSEKQ